MYWYVVKKIDSFGVGVGLVIKNLSYSITLQYSVKITYLRVAALAGVSPKTSDLRRYGKFAFGHT